MCAVGAGGEPLPCLLFSFLAPKLYRAGRTVGQRPAPRPGASPALPLAPEAAGGRPYLAMQERLWGSDNFFFGDSASMRAVCLGVAPRYDEYTHALGQASSEPMLQKHLEEEGLSERVVRFARCVSVDRS